MREAWGPDPTMHTPMKKAGSSSGATPGEAECPSLCTSPGWPSRFLVQKEGIIFLAALHLAHPTLEPALCAEKRRMPRGPVRRESLTPYGVVGPEGAAGLWEATQGSPCGREQVGQSHSVRRLWRLAWSAQRSWTLLSHICTQAHVCTHVRRMHTRTCVWAWLPKSSVGVPSSSGLELLRAVPGPCTPGNFVGGQGGQPAAGPQTEAAGSQAPALRLISPEHTCEAQAASCVCAW